MGEYCVIFISFADDLQIPIGVLLLDHSQGRIACGLIQDLKALRLSDEDEEYVFAFAEEFSGRAFPDAMAFLLQLEDQLSNYLTLSARMPVAFSSAETALTELLSRDIFRTRKADSTRSEKASGQ